MGIPVQHRDDGQSHTNFRRGNHDDKEYEQLTINTCIRIYDRHNCMMHF